MTLNYNITREQASKNLGISTRTLDRYIKKGKISYKKVSNRVLLALEDVEKIKQELDLVNKSYDYTEVVGNTENILSVDKKNSSLELSLEIKDIINQNFQGFIKILQEKDNLINDKNNMILTMQSHIVELESKIKNSIALPDYIKEKDTILVEKEKLSMEKQVLLEELKKQKILNTVYLILLVFVILGIVFFLFR